MSISRQFFNPEYHFKAFLKEKKKIVQLRVDLNLCMSRPWRTVQRSSLLGHPGTGKHSPQNLASTAVKLFIELGLMELFIEQCLMIFSSVEEFSALSLDVIMYDCFR